VQTSTQRPTTGRIPSRLVSRFPGGYAWPATDDRFGRYITCPYESTKPMGLAVVDDFGHLVPVPSCPLFGGAAAVPASGLLA
jgi:hypothetical protein